MTIYEQLLALDWPPAFVVEYTSGEREQLLRGDGVGITPPADDPEGIGGVDADLPRKHPRNQVIGRYVRFSELRAVLTLEGLTLWRRAEPAKAADR
ncbi:hypothetical protein [Gemmata sp.]|uniref:hypothetical protein n=1 Tax=Gemmata sp. TaxID=1914242 RepID=UPI003F6EE1C5